MNFFYEYLTINLLATLMVITIIILLIHIVDLRRRIRALRYCYMDMSNFCVENMDQAIEACSESVNQAYKYTPKEDASYEYTDRFVSNAITQARERWDDILDQHFRRFKSVGLKPINKSDYNYLLE